MATYNYQDQLGAITDKNILDFYSSSDIIAERRPFSEDTETGEMLYLGVYKGVTASDYATTGQFTTDQLQEFYENYSGLSNVQKEFFYEDKTQRLQGDFSSDPTFSLNKEIEIAGQEQDEWFQEQQAEAEEQRQMLASEKIAMRRKETARNMVAGMSSTASTDTLISNEEVTRRKNTNQIGVLDTADIV